MQLRNPGARQQQNPFPNAYQKEKDHQTEEPGCDDCVQNIVKNEGARSFQLSLRIFEGSLISTGSRILKRALKVWELLPEVVDM